MLCGTRYWLRSCLLGSILCTTLAVASQRPGLPAVNLTLIPPSPVTDQIVLELRGAMRNNTGAARTFEAVFEIDPAGPVAALLDEAGHHPGDGQLVVKRELARSGRHRAFVNDGAATVGLLERLGELLVELHGQHEHQRLMEPARQLLLLDRFAEADDRRERVAALVHQWEEARAALDRLRSEMREGARFQCEIQARVP